MQWDCTSSQFKCSNGQCIPADLECDGYPHCFDIGDEIDCSKSKRKRNNISTC